MYPRSNVSHHHNLLNVSAKSRGKTCLHVERQYSPQRRAIKKEKKPDNEKLTIFFLWRSQLHCVTCALY